MWWQFIAQNAHFIVHIGAALVLFAISWLYFDAWQTKRPWMGLLSWLGFALLGVSMLVQSTNIEQTVLGGSIFGSWDLTLTLVLRVSGYLGIIISQVFSPLQPKPNNKGLVLERADQSASTPAVVASISSASAVGWWLLPLAALSAAVLYWRRATTGLERHLKPVAYGFAALALSEALGLAVLARSTSNPILDRWVAAFGPLWLAEQVALLLAACLLGRWIWTYLTKRFFTQLLMVFVTSTVIISLVVSVGFTGLLLRNVRQQALASLRTSGNVLSYTVTTKQQEVSAGAEQVAGSSDIAAALAAHDRPRLIALTKDYLASKKQTGLILVDENGQVLVRAEDTEQWGDSLASDSLVGRALSGQAQSSLVATTSAAGPVLELQSAQPVRNAAGMVAGVAVARLQLGSAFVDGLSNATGLASSVYAGTTLSASTLVGPDGKTRVVGTTLSNASITDAVMKHGGVYVGEVSLGNRAMLGAFLPLTDVDGGTVGMLAIAEPQTVILETAGHSVELTFLMAAALLILSVGPIYIVTKSLTNQLD